jgi:hypothetical protein
VDYINIEELIKSKSVSPDEVRRTIRLLADVLHLDRLTDLEKKNTRRSKRIKEKIRESGGLSISALVVYNAFYQATRDYFEAQGQSL